MTTILAVNKMLIKSTFWVQLGATTLILLSVIYLLTEIFGKKSVLRKWGIFDNLLFRLFVVAIAGCALASLALGTQIMVIISNNKYSITEQLEIIMGNDAYFFVARHTLDVFLVFFLSLSVAWLCVHYVRVRRRNKHNQKQKQKHF